MDGYFTGQQTNPSEEKPTPSRTIEDVEMANSSDLPGQKPVFLTLEDTWAEKRLVRKIDLLALPMISLMYFLASLVGLILVFFISVLN